MKAKRTSWLMIITIIVLVIAVHNTLHSEISVPRYRIVKSTPKVEASNSYFAASFLRMAQ